MNKRRQDGLYWRPEEIPWMRRERERRRREVLGWIANLISIGGTWAFLLLVLLATAWALL